MGSVCSSIQTPNTTNLCNVSVGNRSPEMPGFCSPSGTRGDSIRNHFCEEMGTTEWGTPEGVANGCNYNNCNGFEKMDYGVCGACHSAGGIGMTCLRYAFTGDPVTCCFNDMACSSANPDTNPLVCYSDGSRQNTCADGRNGQPNYRSLTSTDCQNTLMQYCTGTLPTDDPKSTVWLTRWTNTGPRSCYNAVMRNLSKDISPCTALPVTGVTGVCGGDPNFTFSSNGYFWSQRLVNAALEKYESQGFEIGTMPGYPGYNPWQDFMYNNICCPISGLCQTALQTSCATKTKQRISVNPSLSNWCGCHLPIGEYEEYATRFNIPPQCSPTCNRITSIPITGVNGSTVRCAQNICLMDNIAVNLVNSQIGGGINFNQVCGNCGNGQCSCIITDATIDVRNSTIGGNFVPISQGCGNTMCTQTNPGSTGPAIINVECGLTGPFNPYADLDAKQAAATAEGKRRSWLWTVLAIIIGIILIFLIIVILQPIRTQIMKEVENIELQNRFMEMVREKQQELTNSNI